MFIMQVRGMKRKPENEVEVKLGMMGDATPKLDSENASGITSQKISLSVPIAKVGKNAEFGLNVQAGKAYAEKGAKRGGEDGELPFFHSVPGGDGPRNRWLKWPWGPPEEAQPTSHSLSDNYVSAGSTLEISQQSKGVDWKVKGGLGGTVSKQQKKTYGPESILVSGVYVQNRDGTDGFAWEKIERGFPLLDTQSETRFGVWGLVAGSVSMSGVSLEGYYKFNTLETADADMGAPGVGRAGIKASVSGLSAGVAANDKNFKSLQYFAAMREVGDSGLGMGVYYTPEKKDWGFSLSWSF